MTNSDRIPSQIFAYARVSTVEQNLESQLVDLRTVCNESNIITEKASGTNVTGRPELTRLIEHTLRSGDILYVQRLDRLARSTLDLAKIASKLESKNVDLVIMDNAALDTSTISGKMLFTVLGAIAEFETELRKERQLAGIKVAKAEGKYKGRKPLSINKVNQVTQLVESGSMGVSRACREVGIGRTAYYSHIKIS